MEKLTTTELLKLLTDIHEGYADVINKLFIANPHATGEDVKKEMDKGLKMLQAIISIASE